MKNFNTTTDAYYASSQSNLASAAPTHNQERAPSALGRAQPAHDEMSQDLNYLSREAPLDGGESTFGGAQSYSQLAGSQRGEDSLIGESGAGDQAANVDNVHTKKPAQQSG